MKKALTILIILISSITTLVATPIYKLALDVEYSYDTNVFSEPLPMFDEYGTWLDWKSTHPFKKMHSAGFNITFDTFMHEEDRIGISTSLSFKFPIHTVEIKPVAESSTGFTGNWHYEETEVSKQQKPAYFGSIGPAFNARLGFMDIGVAVRLSLGQYDYSTNELILGLQAEPYFNIDVSDHIFINFKFTYEAHMMRFIDSKTEIFEKNYQMISLYPSLGIGIIF